MCRTPSAGVLTEALVQVAPRPDSPTHARRQSRSCRASVAVVYAYSRCMCIAGVGAQQRAWLGETRQSQGAGARLVQGLVRGRRQGRACTRTCVCRSRGGSGCRRTTCMWRDVERDLVYAEGRGVGAHTGSVCTRTCVCPGWVGVQAHE